MTTPEIEAARREGELKGLRHAIEHLRKLEQSFLSVNGAAAAGLRIAVKNIQIHLAHLAIEHPSPEMAESLAETILRGLPEPMCVHGNKLRDVLEDDAPPCGCTEFNLDANKPPEDRT